MPHCKSNEAECRARRWKSMQETRKSIAATVACLLTYTAISPSLADPINLLREFRPIGGVGNNLANTNLAVVPASPELNLAARNFGPGTNDPLVSGPNPRRISKVIAGGTGAFGQNAAATDPVPVACLYV